MQQGNFTSWRQNKLQQDALETAQNAKLKKDISRLQQSARQKADWSAKTEKRKNGSTNSGSKLDKGYVGHKAAKMMKRASTIEARRQSALEECSALMKNIDSAENLQIRPLVYHSEILCSASSLSIQYADNPVVASVDFEIQRRSITALKGKNGSGKSSILKLICGYDVPHTGRFWMGSGIRISYVPQSTDELSGTLAQYADGKGIDYTRFLTLLHKLVFSRQLFDRQLESYSAGQKKKVLLAGSLCEEAHLYVWDEPLNYIDVISRIQIEELLRNADITMIFVEHDREFSAAVSTAEICV